MKLRTVCSWLLLPLTMWYAAGVAVRNFLFDHGLLRSSPTPMPTIGVGNLNVGGSGKTPHTEYLLALLAPTHRTAMLSRGYKRRSKDFVADDGSHSAALLGDEPAMVASAHEEVAVAVCADRMEGLRKMLQWPSPPQVVVLDDVYQHRAVKPTLNLLLTECGNLCCDDRVMPFGTLRESRRGIRRADAVVVTKCPPEMDEAAQRGVASRLGASCPVLFSSMAYGALQPIDDSTPAASLDHFDSLLCVTGIAHPEPMVAWLRRSHRVEHMRFADHHNFSPRDIEAIHDAYGRLDGSRPAVVTTAKDAVRLRGLTGSLPVYVLPIKVIFLGNGELEMSRLVKAATSRE